MKVLINKLKENKIHISLENENLKIKFDNHQISNELLNEIRTNKAKIVQYLKRNVTSDQQHLPIQPASKAACYPLSSSQYRLWVLSQLDGVSQAYNMPTAVRLTGAFDVLKFEKAVRLLIERHEILRTYFKTTESGEVAQYIQTNKSVDFKITIEDYSAVKNNDKVIAEYIRKKNSESFDLTCASLLRAFIIKSHEQEHVFFLSIHHIISDGWSMEILIRELIEVYHSLTNDQPVNLPELTIQYKDFAVWSTTPAQQKKQQASELYWLKQFSGDLPTLYFPSFKVRPSIQTSNGNNIIYHFPKGFLNKVDQFSKKQEVTLFMTLMAGINAVLYRYTGQNDIIIGTSIAGRDHPDLANQLGLYLNTLAIRTKFEEQVSFSDLLKKEKQILLEAYEHQSYPFAKLVEAIDLKRDRSRSALFDIMMDVKSQPNLNKNTEKGLMDLKISQYEFENTTAKVDINFSFYDTTELSLFIDYNTDIYDRYLIDQLIVHFENLLNQAMVYPETPIKELDYLTRSEKEELLISFNSTTVAYPADKTIIDLFEEQVVSTPNNIAVVFEEKSLTYEELNEKANLLGGYLRSKYSIQGNDLIGIKLERSERMLISILGILKSGAAYVPIDPGYPQERISYIEEDSNCKLILDELVLSDFNSVSKEYSKKNLKKINSSGDLVYVIYTSGTTGNPKGVMIEHKSLVNRLEWMQKAYPLSASDVILQKTSYSFDVSVWELLWWMYNGSRVCFLKPEAHKDPKEIILAIEQHSVSVLHFVPSMLGVFLEYLKEHPSSVNQLKSLKQVFTSGEALTLDQNKNFHVCLPDVVLMNLYGPTEASIDVSYFKCSASCHVIPIGKPIDNTELLILDDSKKLVSKGVSGKLYIGGVGLGRGYLNKEALTKEKFIAHPFKSGERLYDTGDLARWLWDGNIEYLGRTDHQVKIRGFRIELGEIEHNIMSYSEEIKQVVVVAPPVNGEKTLVAYFSASAAIDRSALKNYLQGVLPSYMVPNFFLELETLPLNSNGKIDRKVLPAISSEDVIKKEYVAPENKMEEELVSIWQEVLGIEKISVTDNFFELGGHSLIAVRAVNKIQKKLDRVGTINDFFVSPTIRELSKKLSNKKYIAIEKAPAMQFYPLSSSQYRLWILSQLDSGSLAYNIPFVVRLTGDVDVHKFEKAVELLIERHEILRTVFTENEKGEVRQCILAAEAVNFKIATEDYNRVKNKDERIKSYLNKLNNIPFDLTQGLLFKAALIRTKKEEHVFFLSMHHIISDGWSIELMIVELVKIYNAFSQSIKLSLPALTVQYKDYAYWLTKEEQLKEQHHSEMYWLEQFKGDLPVLNLPSFKTRPLNKTYNGNKLTHVFSQHFLENLKKFSKQQDVTLFMTLMAGINLLLHKYSGQDDIIIGTPIAGREHPDLENQLGLYLNTLAIRTKLFGTTSFSALLDAEKKALLGAYEHQQYPFDLLVSKLDVTRDASRSALFDVLVVLQNQNQLKNANQDRLNSLRVSDYEFNSGTAQFDMSFIFSEVDGLALIIQYNTDIYDAYLIERMFSHFENLMDASLSDPKQVIQNIDYLSSAEKKQLVVESNGLPVIYPLDKTVIDLFVSQVLETPDNTAVEFKDNALTYQELNEKSNQFASYLRKNYSISPNDLIGIKLERSEFLIVSILGVLKLGAAYIPIDTSYPADRISYIEKDSNCKLMVDESVHLDFNAVSKKYSKNNLKVISSSSDLAYVIYTSGTTGYPKGVSIAHSSLSNYLFASKDRYLDKTLFNTNFGLFTSLSFDLTITSLFLPLITGGTLKVFAPELNISDILSAYFTSSLSCVKLTPAHISLLGSLGLRSSSIEVAIVGGEALGESHIATLYEINPRIKIFNEYGPTESTVGCVVFEIEPSDKRILIGKPIPNTGVYILDSSLHLCAIGVYGELYIKGSGLAQGYLNRLDLTVEKFISDPFIEGELMYKTGDVCRWLPDWNIDYKGRIDDQIKIRGYRIELGEIESVLLSYSQDIEQVVILAAAQKEEQSLVAYFTSSQPIDKSALRNFLQEKLPAYMIPNFYVKLEILPLTPNGKIDRKALPSISGEDVIKKEYLAPRNKLEGKLALIWQEILDLEQVGISDNFFELGGHSLMIGQVINQVQKELGKSVSFKTFFLNPTIGSLSKELRSISYTAIPKAADMPSYPLTASQSRLWVLSQLQGGSEAYHMPAAIKLKGLIESNKFNDSFRKLISRHEILRTVFKTNESDELRQYIINDKHVDFKIEEKDFSTRADLKSEVDSYLKLKNKEPFDLENGPLIKGSLLKLKPDEYVFFLTLHHLIGDGWSIQIIISEIIQLYNSLVSDNAVNLPALTMQYKDYAVWLRSGEQQQKQETSRSYWLNQFAGDLPVLNLPSFKTRPLIQTFNGSAVRHRFSQKFLNQLKAFSKQQDVTLFMTLMAGINCLLYKYSDQEDIIIGIPVAGREHSDLEHQLGLYLNTLAIRTRLNPADSLKKIVQSQKQQLVNAYEHQDYSFDALVNQLHLKRDASRSALFDVMVVLQNQTQLQNRNTAGLSQLKVSDYDLNTGTTHVDISFVFSESDGLDLTIEYNTDIYDVYLIARMFVHFEKLLTQLITQPLQSLQLVDYLTQSEKEQLLNDFNDTTISYPMDKTIIDLFEEQVKKTPDNIAVIVGNKELTYKSLDEEANQLARYLREQYAIKANDLIALKLERSELVIISILGILKSGAAYVPIDIDNPEDRIAYLVKDSNCKVLVDAAELQKYEAVKNKYPKDQLPKINKPSDLAYVIYTSGTTGNPKGSLLEHKNVVRLFFTNKPLFDFNENDVWTMFHSYSFDFSVWEMYGALLYGGKVIVVSKSVATDTPSFLKLLIERSVTVLNQTPSAFYNLIDCDSLSAKNDLSLRYIIFGGEALQPSHLSGWYARYPSVSLINMYGITETTVHVTYKVIGEKEISSGASNIGKPIPTLTNYVLDNALQIVPIGVTGKLYVSGPGLARGYLNREELTLQRFVDNPFESGKKMYDSGDLVCWLPNGDLEYKGRKDHQVKIRGYRIELGEIEQCISRQPLISQSVVIVKEQDDDKYIVAYYVSNEMLDKKELQHNLGKELPSYMLPSYYVQLDKIPLTINGKVDKKLLPAISGEDIIRKKYVAPRTKIEEDIIAIWQDVLGIEKISITDNFFELGGHSLMLSQVINRIQKQLSKTVSFQTFFSNPTVSGLSDHLTNTTYDHISVAAPSNSYPLTAAQSRIWVLSQLEGGSQAYNIPAVVRLSGVIDVEKLTVSFKKLIARHEILRTVFRINETGEVRQHIVSDTAFDFNLEENNVLSTNPTKEWIDSYFTKKNAVLFDLEQGPLIRGSLLTLGAEEHLFFLSVHHIIGDGWSMELLISEIVKTYNSLLSGVDLIFPILSIQYKDYAVWQESLVRSEKYKHSESYWLEQFSGELPVLTLPSFKTRPLVKTYNGNKLTHRFSNVFSEKLQQYSKAQDVTLFMTLMAGVNVLLHKYSGQEDIIVGTPIAGRVHPDLENQLGLYLNTLAIRTQLSGTTRFSELLSIEKEVLLSAYEHQQYPFDLLVSKLDVTRDTSRSALFDVLVVLQNQSQLRNVNQDRLNNIQVSNYDLNNTTSKFDINFIFSETDALSLVIEFNTDIYDRYLIERMFIHFKNLLHQCIDTPEIQMYELNYLTKGEKQQLIDFNSFVVPTILNKTTIDLFKEQVSKTPDNTAAVFENEQLTYHQLDELSNQLADCLKKDHHISTGDIVGIQLKRSNWVIVSILGILKAGGVFVPIDTDLPNERKAFIIEDTKLKLLITEDEYVSNLDFYAEKLLAINSAFFPDSYSNKDFKATVGYKDAAYIIYTSGSTGKPKGVVIEHGSLTNYLNWAKLNYLTDELANTNFGLFTSLSFDLTISSLFLPLLSGGTLSFFNSEVEVSDILKQYFCSNMSCIKLTPAHISILDNLDVEFSSVSMAIVGGEELRQGHVSILRKLNPAIRIYNEYGPTEATVGCMVFEVKSEAEKILIGKPITNASVFILDPSQKMQAVGVTGEIYIGGAGVARGYLNRPDLTNQKFINNPFQKGEKLYRTGDIGRWLMDGNMEYLGRIDNQVKIRGYRIELGEIEEVLSNYEEIKESIVLVKEKNGSYYLVAYYTSTHELDVTMLNNYLKSRLPVYMIPESYMHFKEFPLTSNGKLDKNALPDIELNLDYNYVAPSSELEETLVQLWADVLKIEKELISVNRNFFELGGNSINIVALNTIVNRKFNCAISIAQMFSLNTIIEMRDYIVRGSGQQVEEMQNNIEYAINDAEENLKLLENI